MSKIKYLTLITLTFFLFFGFNLKTVIAINGSLRVSANSTNVLIGNNVKVTVTISSAEPIGAWEFVLQYDQTKLKLTSTTPATYIVGYGDGVKKTATYTYTFKTLNTGKTTIAVKDTSVLDFKTEKELNLTTQNATININKPIIIPKSNNANLKELTTTKGTLNPEFNPKTTEYTIDINEIINNLTINGTSEDSKATIKGTGEVNLTEGLNSFDIIVTAEDGTQKIYNIKANVFDENPIIVTIDNKEYTVIKTIPFPEIPNNYKQTTITIQELPVLAYENDVTNFLLVALKDDAGNSSLFVYDPELESYTKYNEFNNSIISLYIAPPPLTLELPLHYQPVTAKINDIKVKGWTNQEQKDLILVYALNVVTGDYNLYNYDKNEGTFQRFYPLTQTTIKDLITKYMVIIISSGIIFISLIIIILGQLKANRKYKKIIAQTYKN